MSKDNFMNSVAFTTPQRNHFDLSHDRKFTMRMGTLTPCLVMDVVPGDSVTLRSEQMLRMLPLVAPVMHKIDVFTHYFFVPNRLSWDGWEDFITGGTSIPPVRPYIDAKINPIGSVGDYMGLPTGAFTTEMHVDALPFAAYGRIYNEWFRDENLVDELDVDLVDGDNSGNAVSDIQAGVPLRRAWEKDYFTAALPFQQKGAAVTLSLGTEADIIVKNFGTDVSPLYGNQVTKKMDGTNKINTSVGSDGSALLKDDVDDDNIFIDLNGTHVVDLSQAQASSINELRMAFRLQEYLEKNARGGTRYTESIYVHFGVRSSDARLQRPEYLGGGKSPMLISEVLQSSETTETGTPQGNMSGHGISVGSTHGFSKFFEEHGYIIGVMSIQPKTAYSEGLHKMWTRQDHLDYLIPTFAHLGEQPVYKKELYFFNNTEENDTVFGYNPIYSEYRQKMSSIHGQMRSTLEYWHLGRKFEQYPELNEDFINCDPSNRIFAITDDVDNIVVHQFHQLTAKRPLPKYGIPTF